MNNLIKSSAFILVVVFVSSATIPKQGEAFFFDPLDKLLHTDLPILIGQEPSNKHTAHEEFKDYCESDSSNDDIGLSSAQKIITRSGFKYENHYVMSDDGYITELIRIVNPLANQSLLKQPPVMLMHGGTIDPTAYVWASSIQHKPEPYPRTDESGPIESWNRSLGFVLANNGYDVWLIGTRGSDSKNEGHIKYKHAKSIDLLGSSDKKHDETLLEEAVEARQFWSFTMDDIIQYEVPRQIDRVLEISGARYVSLVTYSQSTFISFTLLAENPDAANKVHALVSMAPVINDVGSNRLSQYGLRMMCGLLPDDVGITLYSEIYLTHMTRVLLLKLAENKYIRYTVIKALFNILFGASAKWLTLYEPALIGHSLMPCGFLQLKQSCQQVMKRRYQKFDYGPIQNELKYGHIKPPKVNITDLHIKNWLVISGSRDNFAPPASVKQILNDVQLPTPYRHINIEGYNHLDLVGAITNDIKVNLPMLEFFDQIQLPPLGDHKRVSTAVQEGKISEDARLKQFIPKDVKS